MAIFKTQVPSLRTVRQIVENYHYMICDESFQRDFVWTLDKQREYIQTVMAGSASSAIILADIASCFVASQNRGTKYGENKLKRQSEDGYNESKVDGHQRTTTLNRFYNNQFTISGQYIDIDGKTHTVENKFYRDLPLVLQNTFLFANIVVTVNSGFTYQEIVKMFVDIQKGAALVPAEIRWAALTPYNTWVKSKRKVISEALGRIPTIAKKLHRKYDVEIFDQTILQLMPSTRESNTGQSNLEEWYNYGNGRWTLRNVVQYIEHELDRAWDIFNNYINPILTQNKVDYGKVSLQTYWAIVAAAGYLWDGGYTIKDPSDLYKFIKEINKGLIQDSKLQQAKDIEVARKAIPVQDDPADSNYYWYRCGVPHDKKQRSCRNQAFLKEFVGRLSGATCVTRQKAMAA